MIMRQLNDQNYYIQKLHLKIVLVQLFVKPDGKIAIIEDNNGRKHIIGVVEVKTQGEGKPQPRGNAVERYGKK